jgi:hypothetical protein
MLASEKREEYGLPPLPANDPPQLAKNYDAKCVMSQVGHADSKTTLDVYAQLEQRIKREHGVRFDAIIRDAEEQMHRDDMSGETRPGQTRLTAPANATKRVANVAIRPGRSSGQWTAGQAGTG